MKYPPQHHQDNDRDHMIEVIKKYPLATLISIKDHTPIMSHLPLMYRDEGKLIGHIDIHNPQTALLTDGQEVSIIFSGCQCYISPSIYESVQLPTWNYIKVHLKGTVQAIISKEQLKDSIITMTTFLEGTKPNMC